MSSISDIFLSTVTKMDSYLEQMTLVVTDHVNLKDSSLTVRSHDGLYNMSIVAEWLHMIPHLDIRFRPLPANVTFDPNDNEYLESLGILVAIPGFWLILTLVFFLIFFLCRCCDGASGFSEQKQFHQPNTLVRKNPKPKKLTSCKLFLALLAFITCFAITISLLGSIIVHSGMNKLQNSTEDIADVLETVQNEVRTAANQLREEVDVNIESLKGAIEVMLVKEVTVKANLETQLFFLKRNVTKCMRRVDEIYSRLDRLNLRPVPDTLILVERIRWISMFVFSFLLVFFCLILLCGLAQHSRCTLILFSVFGLLALVFGWVLSSLYLGILVAGSDFCAEPDSFLTDRFSTAAELALYDYYVRCPYSSHTGNNAMAPNPFRRQTRETIIALEHMSELIRALEMLCINYCNPDQSVRPQITSIVQNLNSTEHLLKSVQGLLDCRRINQDYVSSMTSTCKDLIDGFFLLLITAAAIGLLFTLLVLCASHTWIHIRTINPNSSTSLVSGSGSSTFLGQLESVDETDPFLPSTPRNLHVQHHHHTILSNNSTSSSITNASLTGKRFRDSYGSAYGTTGRGRFSHTPPQTPHFTALGTVSNINAGNTAAGKRSEEQLAFLSPPPAYDQLNQQQQQMHYQQQNPQHQIYGGHHHTGTLPHSHYHYQAHQPPSMVGQHQSAIGHYVADPTDFMMRAPTQATKF